MSEVKETVPSEELPVAEGVAPAADAASEVDAVQVENSSEAIESEALVAEAVVEGATEAPAVEAPEAETAVEAENSAEGNSVLKAVTETISSAVESVKAAAAPVIETVSEAVSGAVESVKAATAPVIEPVVAAVTREAEADLEVVAEAEPVAEVESIEAEPVVVEAEVASEPVAETVVEAPAAEAPAAEAFEAPAAEAAPAESTESTESEVVEHTDASGKRVVKTLAVGQEVQGTVKRVSEFGAFVDIGVGRDGLVHISELSVRRVGKVTDVIKEGDAVTLWIKKLDRERNRISLTMIAPGTRTMRDLNKDDLVTGTVTRILPYGAFIDIGVGRDALLHVREMGERYVAKPEEVVKVGETVEARIIDIQRRRGRIDLSIKGLREEPEPEAAPQAPAREFHAGPRGDRVRPEPEPVAAEPEPPDQFADVDVVSPMELALRKAMEQSGVEFKITKNDKRDKRDKKRYRDEQEEIFARTLKSGK